MGGAGEDGRRLRGCVEVVEGERGCVFGRRVVVVVGGREVGEWLQP